MVVFRFECTQPTIIEIVGGETFICDEFLSFSATFSSNILRITCNGKIFIKAQIGIDDVNAEGSGIVRVCKALLRSV